MRALGIAMVSVFLAAGCSDDNGPPKFDTGVDQQQPWDYGVDMGADSAPDQGQPDVPIDTGGDAPQTDAPPDTLAPDTLAPDTLAPDTLSPDSSGPPPANDTCAAAKVLTWSGATLTEALDTTNATETIDAGGVCSFDGTPGKDVFFKIDLPAGTYSISVDAPGIADPAIYLIGAGCTAADVSACSDAPVGGQSEQLTVAPAATTTYIIGVDAWDIGEAGPYTLTVDIATPTDAGPDLPAPDVLPPDGPALDSMPPDAGPDGPAPDAVPDTTPPDGSVTGTIIITEIIYDPGPNTTITDANGEWFELYNATSSPVNLNGWTISDDGSDSHTIASDVIIPPTSYVVLGRNADTATNGNVTVAYEYTGFALSNSADEIILTDSGGTVVDEVWYTVTGSPPPFPDVMGGSISLKSPALDNNVGANWCAETATWSGSTSSNFGTPNAAAGCQ